MEIACCPEIYPASWCAFLLCLATSSNVDSVPATAAVRPLDINCICFSPSTMRIRAASEHIRVASCFGLRLWD
eukprot:5054382-Pleurochrysis_carterae.AAC.8